DRCAAQWLGTGMVMHGLRILLVEDNRDAADSLALMLSLYGHEVRVARDGPSGLAAAREDTFDVILMDIGLPGMDGWEVARRIRSQPVLPRPCIIAVSGYGQEAERKRSYEAGMDLHLVKPLDLRELERILDLATARHPARRSWCLRCCTTQRLL